MGSELEILTLTWMETDSNYWLPFRQALRNVLSLGAHGLICMERNQRLWLNGPTEPTTCYFNSGLESFQPQALNSMASAPRTCWHCFPSANLNLRRQCKNRLKLEWGRNVCVTRVERLGTHIHVPTHNQWVFLNFNLNIKQIHDMTWKRQSYIMLWGNQFLTG